MPKNIKTIYSLPASDQGGSVVEFSDGGRLYRKQLVKFGAWVNPHDKTKKMVLDRDWAEKVVSNFKNKVLNRVPVAEGHPATAGELVTRTRGELKGMAIEDDGLYGQLEIKAPETAEAIDKDLIYDVSVSFDPEYMDKLSGENVGPALLHVGLVNDPYLKGMAPFQALSDNAKIIMLSESKELEVSKVKNDREFPVEVKFTVDGEEKIVSIPAGEEIEVPEEAAEAVTAQVSEATEPQKTEAEKEAEAAAAKEAEDKAAAEKEAAEKAEAEAKAKAEAEANETELEKTKRELAEANEKIALSDAEKRYNTLLTAGKIVPAQREAFMNLSTAATTGAISLADGATKSLSDLLTDLLEAAPKRISFSEEGVNVDEADQTPYDKLSEEEKAATEALGVTPEEYNEVNGGKSSNKEDK